MPDPAAHTRQHDQRWRSGIEAGIRAADGYTLNLSRITSGRSGEMLGSGVGQSVEFMDFREYEPGDDIRRIDWQVYARSDRVMIRRHREEISPSIEILLDGSRSMDLPGTPKADTALAVGAALASAAIRTGLTTRFAGVHDATPRLKSLRDPRALDWPGSTGTATLADAAPALRSGRSTQGMRIVVSDMLFSCDFNRLVRDLARSAHALVIVQVLAQADADPGTLGSILLRDRETDATIQVDLTAEIVRRYRERFNAHAARLREAASAVGAVFIEIVAPADAPDPIPAIRALSGAGLLRPVR